ncbi:hypothetical protein HYY74_00375 [Candidatus Woesearchaeota archaeon]|nr:hypothetical protein [Candidatus Woesearchaeota archaeon]
MTIIGQKIFKTVKRIDKLPLEVRLALEKKGIFDGLVIFSGVENSPRELTLVEQSFKLPSQFLDEAFQESSQELASKLTRR